MSEPSNVRRNVYPLSHPAVGGGGHGVLRALARLPRLLLPLCVLPLLPAHAATVASGTFTSSKLHELAPDLEIRRRPHFSYAGSFALTADLYADRPVLTCTVSWDFAAGVNTGLDVPEAEPSAPADDLIVIHQLTEPVADISAFDAVQPLEEAGFRLLPTTYSRGPGLAVSQSAFGDRLGLRYLTLLVPMDRYDNSTALYLPCISAGLRDTRGVPTAHRYTLPWSEIVYGVQPLADPRPVDSTTAQYAYRALVRELALADTLPQTDPNALLLDFAPDLAPLLLDLRDQVADSLATLQFGRTTPDGATDLGEALAARETLDAMNRAIGERFGRSLQATVPLERQTYSEEETAIASFQAEQLFAEQYQERAEATRAVVLLPEYQNTQRHRSLMRAAEELGRLDAYLQDAGEGVEERFSTPDRALPDRFDDLVYRGTVAWAQDTATDPASADELAPGFITIPDAPFLDDCTLSLQSSAGAPAGVFARREDGWGASFGFWHDSVVFACAGRESPRVVRLADFGKWPVSPQQCLQLLNAGSAGEEAAQRCQQLLDYFRP